MSNERQVDQMHKLLHGTIHDVLPRVSCETADRIAQFLIWRLIHANRRTADLRRRTRPELAVRGGGAS
jgi:hypothetical protein